jgi:hypothetical protein
MIFDSCWQWFAVKCYGFTLAAFLSRFPCAGLIPLGFCGVYRADLGHGILSQIVEDSADPWREAFETTSRKSMELPYLWITPLA